MAENYTYGTATSASDLLSDIKDFLVTTCGWTQNEYGACDSGDVGSTFTGNDTTGNKLHIKKQDSYGNWMYFNFRSCINCWPFPNSWTVTSLYGGYTGGACTGIAMNGSTGYNAANAWYEQPGAPTTDSDSKEWGGCIMDLGGSINYWMVEVNDTYIIAVEHDSGYFQWMIFGCLKKMGSYDYGHFFSCSFNSYQPAYYYYYSGPRYTPFSGWFSTGPSGAVLLNSVDTWSNEWVPMGCNRKGHSGDTAQTGYIYHPVPAGWESYGVDDNFISFLLESSPNNFAHVQPMMPLYTVLRRDPSTLLSLIGWPEGINHISMDAINNKDEITIVSDKWLCLPQWHRTDNLDSFRAAGGTFEGIPGFAIKID